MGTGGHQNTTERAISLILPWTAQYVPLQPSQCSLWAAEASWGDLVGSFHRDGDETTWFWSQDRVTFAIQAVLGP